MSPTELIDALRHRCAVRKFDPARKIDPAAWKVLEEALVLTPSSWGLQPWRFVVVTDPAVRAKLREASWNQPQITDASHLVVFAARPEITEADVDRYLARVSDVRGQPLDSLAKFRKVLVGDLVTGPRSENADHWAALQVYIALGNFMTAAATIGVDTCPMEGIVPARYDEILGLPAEGYRTVVVCTAGHRADDDPVSKQPKVRFPADDVVRRV